MAGRPLKLCGHSITRKSASKKQIWPVPSLRIFPAQEYRLGRRDYGIAAAIANAVHKIFTLENYSGGCPTLA